MLRSATISFKLDSNATQEQLLLIKEEITSYFQKTSLKPQEIICRKGSVEVIIVFVGQALLYVGDKVFGGALEDVGRMFLSWIRDKFALSPQSNMPLDDQKMEMLKGHVNQLTQQSIEGLTVPEIIINTNDMNEQVTQQSTKGLIVPETSQSSETDVANTFKLFDSILKSDGEAAFTFTKQIDGSPYKQVQGVKVTKGGGKILEISEFKSYKLDE